ncbi:MAG: homoserine kinase [Pseudomonadota bacterium]|nr:homoserine kinase [Pseudomonadota bacterium]
MAVYTPLTRQDIESFLAHYDIGALTEFEGIAEGIENTNYVVCAGDGKYILTLFEKRVRIEDLPYFVALMEWWNARGIRCPQPVHMRNGRALAALKEKPALVVSFLEGGGVERIELAHVAQLGKLAADMHVAGMEFPHVRQNALSLAGWEAIIDRIIDQVEEIEPGLRRLINEEYNDLSEHWPQGLPGGPIHADLFPDNVFFSKSFGKAPVLSGVIDFYFSCNDAWAYDLAICVNAWCFDARHRFVPERAQALMQAYTDQRPLTPEEEAAFPLLLRGAALRFLLTRAHDWLHHDPQALVTPKDPLEYAAKLRFFQKNGV